MSITTKNVLREDNINHDGLGTDIKISLFISKRETPTSKDRKPKMDGHHYKRTILRRRGLQNHLIQTQRKSFGRHGGAARRKTIGESQRRT